MKKTLLNWFHTVMNMKPMKPTPVTYTQVAIKYIKIVGVNDDLCLDVPIKVNPTCWIWKISLNPNGIFWLMDGAEQWGELEMNDPYAPMVLEQLYNVLLSIKVKQIKIA